MPDAPDDSTVHELRTYRAAQGRMDDLIRRFEDHTVALFAEHHMESLAYWRAVDDDHVLVYLLRHDGDPERNWASFRADPRWQEARADSERDGSLTDSIDAIRLRREPRLVGEVRS